jgi:hypothetical protein
MISQESRGKEKNALQIKSHGARNNRFIEVGRWWGSDGWSVGLRREAWILAGELVDQMV